MTYTVELFRAKDVNPYSRAVYQYSQYFGLIYLCFSQVEGNEN